MRYVVSVAVVTKMKFSMEVTTEVEWTNAIKPVMKVPAEIICEESSTTIVTEMKFLLQVENMFDGSEITIMTSAMEVAS